MPTYSTTKTYRGGFYTNENKNGVDDRVYSAEDIRKPYNVIFTDGVRPDVDGTAGDILKVVPISGLTIGVSKGFAMLGGAWFENASTYNITLDNATSSTRYDCVIVRNDDNKSVREPLIYVKSLDHIPTIDDLTRANGIYEICLAYVTVTSGMTNIKEENITDTRTSGDICNLMTGVGATVVRAYRSTYTTTKTSEADIPINIKQFDRTYDELIVSVEGVMFREGSQYTILSNEKIRLTIPLPVIGTKVDFVVHKNVNGSASGNAIEEVTQLSNAVTSIQQMLSHDYYCNGINDNVQVSELVKTYISEMGYGSVKLNIHGTFGATNPVSTSSTTDRWLDLSGESNMKVILDFTDASGFLIPTTNGKTNVIFYGDHINVIGLVTSFNNPISNTSIVLFNGEATIIYCENCRFWITADKNSYISHTGTFMNCRGSVTNRNSDSYCFKTIDVSLLKLYGGEYYAYTYGSTYTSAVVGQVSGANAIAILDAVNMPTVARSGYTQTYCVHQNNGWMNCTETITTLPYNVLSGQSNVRGKLELNKPNLI